MTEHRDFLRIHAEFRATNDRLDEAYGRYVAPERPLWRRCIPSGHQIVKDKDGRLRAYISNSYENIAELRANVAQGENASGDDCVVTHLRLRGRDAKAVLVKIEQYLAEEARQRAASGVAAAEEEADGRGADLVEKGLAILEAEPSSLRDVAIQASVSLSYGFGQDVRREVLQKLTVMAGVPCLAEEV